jgi:hypothetical protein
MALTGSQSANGASAVARPHQLTVGYPNAAALAILLMLGFYIVLKPYYLLPSGLPQIADMLLIMALPLVLCLPQPQQNRDERRIRFCMLLFCSYAVLVSLGWTFVLMDERVALYAAYYIFNLCLLVICLRVGTLHPQATFRVIAYSIVLSAAIQATAIALTYDVAKLRQIASFNNPNQLGYWSLLSLCIFWSVAGEAKVKWYIQAQTTVCLFYTAAVSLSKATMIAMALLCLLRFFRRPTLMLVWLIALGIGTLAMENSILAERVGGRLQDIGQQQDDTIGTRGYSRMLNNLEYVVLGAGEGALYRFGEASGGEQMFEIHSTFGTILFSYGLIGLAAFTAAIWRLYRISSSGRFLYLLPPFFYGLTHQGLRFSFLWLLLAVIAVLGVTSLSEETVSGGKANLK